MKDLQKIKREKRRKRAVRARSKIFGTLKKPRLSIFRSNKHIYVQLIDDERGKTLASASGLELKNEKMPKSKKAVSIGKLIADKAAKLNIKEVIFHKGGYKYHGAIKATAEGAREGGLKF